MENCFKAAGEESGHVVMLLNNPCTNDSRVIKSAEALAQDGWKVTVVCRHQRSLPRLEVIKGVSYQRLKPLPDVSRVFIKLKEVIFPHSSARKAIRSRSLEQFFTVVEITKTRIKSGCPASFKSVIRTFRHQRRILRNKLRSLASKKNRLGRMLNFMPRMFHRRHETDEFMSIAFRHVLSLKPDVVHCHDLATLPAGAAIAEACRCKLVYDSHELEMHRNATYPKYVSRMRRRLEKSSIVKTDAVITVSESIADHLREDYKISRPYVVMNAPDFDDHLTAKDLREDIGLLNNTPLAVYVGSVTINRGIDFVIRSLPHNPQLHFATVGPRRTATQVELHELAIALGVRDRVHFVDPVPPNDVVGYIRTADVSVLPIQNVCLSYYYCMPNKLLESVFAGIPVAVADLLEMRRFVETYQCGVVMDETDPQSIAEAISKIIASRAQYVLPGDKRHELTERYSWTTQANRLQDIYDQFKVKAHPKSSLRKVAA